MSKIISVPHPALRQQASLIVSADKKTEQLLANLSQTLRIQDHPKGVGLAAPQINVSKQMFVTLLSHGEDQPSVLTAFINPKIMDRSDDLILGETPADEEPRLEGCLSIPRFYGPVPRFRTITMSYFTLENEQLMEKTATFENFPARVIQHEYDHLFGILFTDYSLEYDLPVYQEDDETGKLEEIDKRVLEAF